ncbi:MAG: hypothetical protein WDA09_06655 [Bacteriovoracaceae bacterium]
MKKENTVSRKIKANVVIKGRKIDTIWFDLKHIECGWDESKRDYSNPPKAGHTRFSEEEVVGFFGQLESFSSYKEVTPKKMNEQRFAFKVYDSDLSYTMIVSLYDNLPKNAVIITIYKK